MKRRILLSRVRRNIVKGREEIDFIIDTNGMKYIFVNNNIFDDFYEKGKVKCRVAGRKETHDLIEEDVKFTELDMIVFIFIHFMSKNKFTLNKSEMAKYINCSSKQLKVSLDKLRKLEGKTNIRFRRVSDDIEIIDEKSVPLISEKYYSAYNPKTKKRQQKLHWFVNFLPKHEMKIVEGVEKAVPINFFMVTIDDFRLLLDDTLSRNEFITYMWLLRRCKYGVQNKGQVWWSYSKIAEYLNYKLPETVQNHIEILLATKINDTPLLDEIRPDNYEFKIMQGEEPSSKFIPVYNPLKMMEMSFGKEEVSSEKVEMSLKETEVSLKKEEMSNEELEMILNELEMDSVKEEVNSKIWEVNI